MTQTLTPAKTRAKELRARTANRLLWEGEVDGAPHRVTLLDGHLNVRRRTDDFAASRWGEVQDHAQLARVMGAALIAVAKHIPLKADPTEVEETEG
jgi:hypothetical protein